MHRKLYLVRLVFITVCLLVVYGALARHLYRLQVGRHDELYDKARAVYTSSKTQKGRRGRIFDATGNLLAGNLAGRDILAEPRRFKNRTDEIVESLSTLLDLDPVSLRSDFEQKGRIEVVVKRGVDIRTAETVLGHGFPGIRGVDSYRRYYPKDSLAANMLGYMDYDGRGVSGIEQLLDEKLQPTEGRTVYERDRAGNPLQDGKRSEEEPRDGADVHLTIDEPIQQIVEEELRELVSEFTPKGACAVMLNPKTGALLAVAQYPAFNANDRETMENASNCQNRVLLQGFEPGSVMKPIAVSGALDYGVVTLDDVFDCEHGYWVYCRRPLRDSGHQYDDLSVREIIQKSSNIGTAKIAILMGESRLYNTLLRFGFGQPTGLGFRRESRGILRSAEDWDGLSITRFPIGQGVLVTPLQLVQAYGALANGGVVMKPYIVERVEGYHREELPPGLGMKVIGRAIRPESCARIVEAMKLVTREGGTATKAAVPGYDVAGKTGTAQKWVSEDGGPGHYSHSQYVSTFIGFVPADDPAFVLLVAADEPNGSSYGGTVAAPTFSRIAEKTLRYLQIAPTTGALSSIAGNYGVTHAAQDPVPEVP